MQIIKKINNGVLLIVIGIMHTQFALSSGGFGKQFWNFSSSYFFKISKGIDELPATQGITDFETFSTFWFFYFGLLLFPMGILAHHMEKEKSRLPPAFTVTYFVIVALGCYMIPNSGMTYFMLPHAIYMLVNNYLKMKKSQKTKLETS